MLEFFALFSKSTSADDGDHLVLKDGKINILPWIKPSFFSSVGNAYW